MEEAVKVVVLIVGAALGVFFVNALLDWLNRKD